MSKKSEAIRQATNYDELPDMKWVYFQLSHTITHPF